MLVSEIDALDKSVDSLIRDGARSSASQLLSDTVSRLVRSPYALEKRKKFLVHYTTIDALFSLLSCSLENNATFKLSSNGSPANTDAPPSYLRLYDTFHTNDPDEGQLVVGPIGHAHRFSKQHPQLWKLLQDRSKLPAYVTAFRGIRKIEDADNLVFWRTYGREGKGCALVFPISFLDHCTPVLEVQYGEERIKSALENLSTVFDGLSSATSIQEHGLLYSTGDVPKYVTSALSPIPYLHKSKDFRFENEVRVVMPYVDLFPNDLSCHQVPDSASGAKLRHFAHLPALAILNLLRTDSVLYLGPAVPSKKNLAFVIKRRLHHFGLVGTDIRPSKIGYQS